MTTYMKRGWWIGKFLVMGVAAVALFGWVTMSLWNWLVPVLFQGPILTFWQALGLLVLSKILFGGVFKGGGWRHRPGHWGQMASRWNSLTPEERERFKARMKEKWCRPADQSHREEPTANG